MTSQAQVPTQTNKAAQNAMHHPCTDAMHHHPCTAQLARRPRPKSRPSRTGTHPDYMILLLGFNRTLSTNKSYLSFHFLKLRLFNANTKPKVNSHVLIVYGNEILWP